MDPTLQAHLTALLARGQRGIALGLDRVHAALRTLGDPHLAAPGIIVAGTNGKGSTCAMIEAIGRAAGLRTGLTTSPHLARFAERIRIDGAPIEDAAFASALGRVLVDAPGDLTFFETLTCAAFVAFAEARLDLVVLEVGLGGRHDATNVLPRPLATAIASITVGDGRGQHLEHANFLGGTVDAIAREKAGIFRAGSPAALAPLSMEARAAVLDVARAVGVREVWEVVRASSADGGAAAPDPDDSRGDGLSVRPVRVARSAGGLVAIDLPGAPRVTAHPGLLGAHQADNAALAAATAWLAGAQLPALRGAIARGLESARWPGRLERLDLPAARAASAEVWLDAAHNLDGARALAEAWRERGPGPDRTILVFGALADKAFGPVLAELAPLAHCRIYTSPKGRAPAPLAALDAEAPGEAADEPTAAIARALALAAPGDAILVCGSIYLVGEVRAHLLGEPRDPPIGL